MNLNYIPESGDIVWVDFTPQSGHEQKGRRPALILSPAIYNAKSGLCLCVPITSKIKGYPFEVALVLDKPSVILSDQIKSIDYFARNAEFIKKADESTLQEVRNNIIQLLRDWQSVGWICHCEIQRQQNRGSLCFTLDCFGDKSPRKDESTPIIARIYGIALLYGIA